MFECVFECVYLCLSVCNVSVCTSVHIKACEGVCTWFACVLCIWHEHAIAPS